MQQTVAFLFAAVVLMTAGSALAQPTTIQGEKWDSGAVADPNVYFLSSAPEEGPDFHYRISFYSTEIYDHIVVEQISVRRTEGDTKEGIAAHQYNSFDLGEKLGIEQLTKLQFVKWTAWNTFIAREGDKRFRVQLKTDGAIQVSRTEGW